MNDALLVGRFEGTGDLAGDRQGILEIERARDQPLLEGPPGRQLHHQEPHPADLFERMDRRDVGDG